MSTRHYLRDADTVMEQITRGAFLTVRASGRLNTMTIGWASIGFIWRKQIFMVAVRDSRHTFELIENSSDFTVTVPVDQSFRKAVMFCGTKSGRDYDKFAECGLREKKALMVDSPIIDIPGTHFECRIVHKSPMDPALLHDDLQGLYPENDYHTLYFGEILACYDTK